MESVSVSVSNVSWIKNVPSMVYQYKYWIIGVLIVVALIFFASKAENNSQEAALAEELEAQQNLKTKKIPINHKKLGHLFYKQYQTGKISDRKQNYIKAITHFERCFENDLEVCATLAKLFHNGLAESYDKNGAKVTGIAPNAEKSIFFYKKAAQMGDGESLLQMADIYHWGLLGFQPNKEYAKELYTLLQQIGTDYQKGIAKDRLLQIKEEDGTSIGGSGGLSAANPSIDQAGFGVGFEQFGQNILDGDGGGDNDFENSELAGNKNTEALSQQLGINHVIAPKVTSEKFENNPHNVTDHVIDNTIRQTIAKLKTATPILFQEQQTFRDIKRWILAQRCGEDKKKDALTTLEEIGKSLNQRSYEETLEIEAIQLVWNRIHSNVNAQHRNTLKQNLFNELAECIEYGQPVCRKGRITRIVDVLNGVDPDVNIKPKWALNEEMMRTAAVMRSEAIKLSKQSVQDAINSPNPSPDQMQLIQQFQEKFQKDLVRNLFVKYVDSGLMSKELLKTEISKWIDHI